MKTSQNEKAVTIDFNWNSFEWKSQAKLSVYILLFCAHLGSNSHLCNTKEKKTHTIRTQKTRIKNCTWWTGTLLDKSLISSLALMIIYGSLVFLVVDTVMDPST